MQVEEKKMSGGSLNYWNANGPIDILKKELLFAKNKYSEKAIQVMQETIHKLREAEIYSHRVEWFLSGDDGEENLHERLKEDLEELAKEKPIPVHLAKCEYCEHCKNKHCEYDRNEYWNENKEFENHYQKYKDDASGCWDFEVDSETQYNFLNEN